MTVMMIRVSTRTSANTRPHRTIRLLVSANTDVDDSTAPDRQTPYQGLCRETVQE